MPRRGANRSPALCFGPASIFSHLHPRSPYSRLRRGGADETSDHLARALENPSSWTTPPGGTAIARLDPATVTMDADGTRSPLLRARGDGGGGSGQLLDQALGGSRRRRRRRSQAARGHLRPAQAAAGRGRPYAATRPGHGSAGRFPGAPPPPPPRMCRWCGWLERLRRSPPLPFTRDLRSLVQRGIPRWIFFRNC